MSEVPTARCIHQAAASTVTVNGEALRLIAVNVNKGVSTSVVTISDVAGNTIAVIDAATKSYNYYGGILCIGGIVSVMATANSDVTISYV